MKNSILAITLQFEGIPDDEGFCEFNNLIFMVRANNPSLDNFEKAYIDEAAFTGEYNLENPNLLKNVLSLANNLLSGYVDSTSILHLWFSNAELPKNPLLIKENIRWVWGDGFEVEDPTIGIIDLDEVCDLEVSRLEHSINTIRVGIMFKGYEKWGERNQIEVFVKEDALDDLLKNFPDDLRLKAEVML